MQKFKKIIALTLVISMFLLAGCAKKETEVTTEEGVKIDTTNAVAIINSDIITIDSYNKQYEIFSNMYKTYYGEDVLEKEVEGIKFSDTLREDVLNMLVHFAVIRNYVVSTGYTVNMEEVQTKYQEMLTSLETDEETKKFYETIGADETFLKNEIENGFINAQFEKIVNEMIDTKTEELEALYGTYPVKVKARHILVDDETLANDIKVRLDAGEDFTEIVKEHSKDTGSVESGGSLGYFARGVMVPEFEKAAFSMPIGAISDPIQSSFGYHIIQVEDLQTLNAIIELGDEEEAIETYKAEIKASLFDQYYEAKIEEITAASTVETYVEKVKP